MCFCYTNNLEVGVTSIFHLFLLKNHIVKIKLYTNMFLTTSVFGINFKVKLDAFNMVIEIVTAVKYCWATWYKNKIE